MTVMADISSRRGASNMGVPLMILTFILIGGFMYWLSGQAAAERLCDALRAKV